jgi:hypothetical protein
MGFTGDCNYSRTLPQIPLPPRIPSANRPLRHDLAEFQEPGRTDSLLVQRLHKHNFTSENQGRKNTNTDALSATPGPAGCARQVDKKAEAWRKESSVLPLQMVWNVPL